MFKMWALVRRTDRTEEEIEIDESSCIETGDILDDGSVVLAVRYQDDDDFDARSLGFFADEADDDYL